MYSLPALRVQSLAKLVGAREVDLKDIEHLPEYSPLRRDFKEVLKLVA